ncbi:MULTISPECIES: hypothetical protein [unclassified Frankia]|uniref:hypothetical protein n=2 Tax=Frankia TaxID=1854 RepID=UPI001EF4292C|nr:MULTISPECIES: hypothetical protein [unclassified Frankia]
MDTANVQQIRNQLVRILRRGGRPAELVTYTPEFVDLVWPVEAGMPRQGIHDRAILAHRLLTAAVATLDQPHSEATGIMLCLWPGTLALTLDQRRERAARLFGVQPGTFRRPAHEGHLLLNLSLEIYLRVRDRHDRRRTLPTAEHGGVA